MNKQLAAVAVGLAVALGALSTAAPAYADGGPAVVDHEDDGERQQVILNDVNQDQRDTNGPVDMVREKILHFLSSAPNFGGAALGPAGETQPGFAVMSEEGKEKIED
ncbi:hypothetical protein [Streptomyces rhizosphaerihabitans]|uniref:hypothetical protein n=1 Tax=Streptomyces rhizosphaerihabitans TaxID=1266770 RepID=UPI0021C17BF6|nr:hypothetical protein [Streptomyces rhizosphaerihabitans]MCT9004637.1 hypothetical protein [Streptomyces rhizosphaerihabitans]